MNVKVKDLMQEQVVTAQRHHTVEHVRGLLERNRIHAVPVVGVLSAFDLLALVEDRRFVAKNAPTSSVRKGTKRT